MASLEAKLQSVTADAQEQTADPYCGLLVSPSFLPLFACGRAEIRASSLVLEVEAELQ